MLSASVSRLRLDESAPFDSERVQDEITRAENCKQMVLAWQRAQAKLEKEKCSTR